MVHLKDFIFLKYKQNIWEISSFINVIFLSLTKKKTPYLVLQLRDQNPAQTVTVQQSWDNFLTMRQRDNATTRQFDNATMRQRDNMTMRQCNNAIRLLCDKNIFAARNQNGIETQYAFISNVTVDIFLPLQESLNVATIVACAQLCVNKIKKCLSF